VLLHRAALSELFSQTVHISEIASTRLQHVALSLVEPHYVHRGLLFKPLQSPWMTSLLSVAVTAPLSLVSSANLLRVHSIPLSTSKLEAFQILKTFNSLQ